MTNDSNRTNTTTTKDASTGNQGSKQGFGQNQGTSTGGRTGNDSQYSGNDSSRKAGDTMAKDIGRHADDGVRTNSLEKDGAKQAPSRNER